MRRPPGRPPPQGATRPPWRLSPRWRHTTEAPRWWQPPPSCHQRGRPPGSGIARWRTAAWQRGVVSGGGRSRLAVLPACCRSHRISTPLHADHRSVSTRARAPIAVSSHLLPCGCCRGWLVGRLAAPSQPAPHDAAKTCARATSCSRRLAARPQVRTDAAASTEQWTAKPQLQRARPQGLRITSFPNTSAAPAWPALSPSSRSLLLTALLKLQAHNRHPPASLQGQIPQQALGGGAGGGQALGGLGSSGAEPDC